MIFFVHSPYQNSCQSWRLLLLLVIKITSLIRAFFSFNSFLYIETSNFSAQFASAVPILVNLHVCNWYI